MTDFQKIYELKKMMYEMMDFIKQNQKALSYEPQEKELPEEIRTQIESPIFDIYLNRETGIFSVEIQHYIPRSFRNEKLASYEKKMLYELFTLALDNFEKREGLLPKWEQVFVIARMKTNKLYQYVDPQNYSFLPLFDPLENRLFPADNGQVIRGLYIQNEPGDLVKTSLVILPYDKKDVVRACI